MEISVGLRIIDVKFQNFGSSHFLMILNLFLTQKHNTESIIARFFKMFWQDLGCF